MYLYYSGNMIQLFIVTRKQYMLINGNDFFFVVILSIGNIMR